MATGRQRTARVLHARSKQSSAGAPWQLLNDRGTPSHPIRSLPHPCLSPDSCPLEAAVSTVVAVEVAPPRGRRRQVGGQALMQPVPTVTKLAPMIALRTARQKRALTGSSERRRSGTGRQHVHVYEGWLG